MPKFIESTRKRTFLSIFVAAYLAILYVSAALAEQIPDNPATPNTTEQTAKAYFAGGCFWCVEADFDKVEGVLNVDSGYTGGSAATATYKQVSYSETGHFEAVEVTYDPSVVSYQELVDYFWRQVDPTDPDGQFCDKGSSYRTAIFYSNENERKIIEQSLNELRDTKPFKDPIVTTIKAAKPFYAAEEYHQDYYQKNPIRYKFYRNGCRRDARLKELWGASSEPK